MPLDMDVGLSLGDFALDGDPAPSPSAKRGRSNPIVGPHLLWPKGWMDQGATRYSNCTAAEDITIDNVQCEEACI